MRAANDQRLKLAIVGCGAVTEKFHLPAARDAKGVEVKVLVDKDVSRARTLAREFGVPIATDDWADVDHHAEAALVALPHNLHAPAAMELLGRGIHTLVEKPMALTLQDCDAMIAEAARNGLVLAVGLHRRFGPAFQFTKHSLDLGLIGEVTDFDIREGRTYDWPLKSGFRFEKESSGGGVLVDTGSHVTDLLLWWLGAWKSVEYYDDAMGGVEANCELRLRLQNGVPGFVELSRTRDLRNSCILRGTRGVLEIGVGVDSFVRLRAESHETMLDGHAVRDGVGREGFLDAFRKQLEDFACAVHEGRPPLVPGAEGRRSVALIEACYASRRPLTLPWDL